MTITTNNNKQYITTINETEIVKYLITNTSFIEDKLFTKQYRTTSQNNNVGSPPIPTLELSTIFFLVSISAITTSATLIFTVPGLIPSPP